VALLMAGGLSHKQVAQLLNLSPATVRNHITEVYRRLAVQNVVELAQALGRAQR
jgi:DNA-binding NarL/FixJ family response regulator